MTIQDLGAIGEFVASIAVLVTLLFLVVQMRQNTVILKRTSVRQAASEHTNALRIASLDGEIADTSCTAAISRPSTKASTIATETEMNSNMDMQQTPKSN